MTYRLKIEVRQCALQMHSRTIRNANGRDIDEARALYSDLMQEHIERQLAYLADCFEEVMEGDRDLDEDVAEGCEHGFEVHTRRVIRIGRHYAMMFERFQSML